jgi:serine/threonine protein kinase
VIAWAWLSVSERFGTWQLDSLIAVGGLGEVWHAHRDGETAAVKRLHTHLMRNDEALRMFALEQQLAIGLPRHPNVVHGLEADDVAERPYVALERAPGADLRKLPAVSRAQAIAIVATACDGLAHLHGEGWVHGDVNPGNLIVDGDRAVVIDLGVARRIGEGGAVRGTHAYMAPEQVRGQAWTPATDVFALGVVLWELIAGARLFHRGPPWLSMAAVIESAVPPLPDPRLDAIVQAALAKEPARRTASADALAIRLRTG